MHVEITRLITRWMEDPTYGVNALLPGITRLTGVGDATDSEPPPVTIYNDVDLKSGSIASTLGIDPPKKPALVIVADSVPETQDMQGRSAAHEFKADVGFGYYGDVKHSREKAIIAGDYTLRAVKKSLRRFNEAPQPTRQLNGIMIARVVSVETERVAGAVGASVLMGMLFARMTVLDKAP